MCIRDRSNIKNELLFEPSVIFPTWSFNKALIKTVSPCARFLGVRISKISFLVRYLDTVSVTLGGTGITSAPKGSVLVANAANTFSALEGSTDGDVLTYNATSDTISWEGSVDGGTY